MAMWKVVTQLKNAHGDITDMTYASSVNDFDAIHAAMSAISMSDDTPWVTIAGIQLIRIED